MTQRDTERQLWAILANHLRNQPLDDLMTHAGWVPDTVPAKEARRWARATERVAQIIERRAMVHTRRPCSLAGQMTIPVDTPADARQEAAA